MSTTFEELAPYFSSSDGRDTTRALSDEELARAIADTGNLLSAAVALSEKYGRIVARTDIATRVEASPQLGHILEAAREARMERAVVNGLRRIAEAHHERQRIVAEWRRLHEERVHLCELRRGRNQGPRCGAKTRTGAPCERKVVVGKRRCPNHGGRSTGPRTPEGRARSLAALRRGRERARQDHAV